MERLTYWNEELGLWSYHCASGDAAIRLAAYEDTGMTPEQVMALAKAEKDGKLEVVPCKKGDKLFVLTSDSPSGIEETKCKRIEIINREGVSRARVWAKCVYDDWGGALRKLDQEDFGKIVFLTREEAEAALKQKINGEVEIRDILFRGKRIDNREWVFGFYWKDLWGDGESCYIHYDSEDYEVDPETVGQYTGLTDKSGNRIFEGDIVVCKKYIGGNFVDYCIEIGFVEMRHGAFGLHRKQGYYRPFKDWLEDYEYEVIRSIHDNPELLKEEDNG